jgi:LCP family protein required for cell wall assembly
VDTPEPGTQSSSDQGPGTLWWAGDSGAAAPPAPGPPNPAGPRVRSRGRGAWKVLGISVIVLVVLVAGAAATMYWVTSSYVGSMHRIGNPFVSIPAPDRAPQPAGPAANDVTFLVGGLDTRSAVPTTGSSAPTQIWGRTDTLMLVHLIAGGRGAYVVSIPRDSWVPIPGHGDGKINWAYIFGGPSLAVRTVERLTHVRINHVAVIDWAGFRGVTNALGGVTIDIPVTSYDSANQVTWTAGTHHLNGAQALLYVRDRYGLPGGDFDREHRQQAFLRAVFAKLHGDASLTNPLRMNSLMHSLTRAVSVDSTLGLSQMTRLALSLKGVNSGNIVFATVPYTGTGMAGTQSVVRLDRPLDQGFWHAFEYDSLPAFMQAHHLQQLGATTP